MNGNEQFDEEWSGDEQRAAPAPDWMEAFDPLRRVEVPLASTGSAPTARELLVHDLRMRADRYAGHGDEPAIHPDLRAAARLRALADFVERLADHDKRLTGLHCYLDGAGFFFSAGSEPDRLVVAYAEQEVEAEPERMLDLLSAAAAREAVTSDLRGRAGRSYERGDEAAVMRLQALEAHLERLPDEDERIAVILASVDEGVFMPGMEVDALLWSFAKGAEGEDLQDFVVRLADAVKREPAPPYKFVPGWGEVL